MIDIAINVPDEMLDHPELQRQVLQLSSRFNSDEFDRKQRTLTCLHEGTHIHYSRLLGFEPKLYGPSVRYEPETKTFRMLEGAVEGLPEDIQMHGDPLMVAKSMRAPRWVEEQLFGDDSFKVDEYRHLGDLMNYNRWSTRRYFLMRNFDPKVLLKVRQSVLKDLRSPAFRRKLWDAAREYEMRVFGKVN